MYGIIWSLAQNDYQALGDLWSLIHVGNKAALHITHEFRIDCEILEAPKGCDGFYFEPANLIISKEINKVLIHPYSERQTLIERHRKLVNNFYGFHFSIEIVDNEHHIQKRFMPLGKIIRDSEEEEINVIEITPFADPVRDSGVYVTTVNSRYQRGEPIRKRYTFEQAQALFNLYSTKEEAKTHGNISANIQKEIEKLKNDNFLRKEELERTRIELKAKETEIEKLKQQIEEEKIKREEEYEKRSIQRKDEQEQRKDYYEQRSYERKDNSELVKYMPTILVGVIGIIIAVFKFI
jgi:hypothetical protein